MVIKTKSIDFELFFNIIQNTSLDWPLQIWNY